MLSAKLVEVLSSNFVPPPTIGNWDYPGGTTHNRQFVGYHIDDTHPISRTPRTRRIYESPAHILRIITEGVYDIPITLQTWNKDRRRCCQISEVAIEANLPVWIEIERLRVDDSNAYTLAMTRRLKTGKV